MHTAIMLSIAHDKAADLQGTAAKARFARSIAQAARRQDVLSRRRLRALPADGAAPAGAASAGAAPAGQAAALALCTTC